MRAVARALQSALLSRVLAAWREWGAVRAALRRRAVGCRREGSGAAGRFGGRGGQVPLLVADGVLREEGKGGLAVVHWRQRRMRMALVAWLEAVVA